MASDPNYAAAVSFGAALLGSAETNLQVPASASLVVAATSARQFTDGATTSGSTTVTSTSQAAFANGDIGRPISHANLPAGTVITKVASATSISVSQPATATASALTITLGGGAGLKIEEVVLQASATTLVATTVAGLVYLFLNDGSTYRLYNAVAVTATTASATAAPFRLVTPFVNLWLPAGWSLYASQSIAGNASLLECFAAGGAY